MNTIKTTNKNVEYEITAAETILEIEFDQMEDEGKLEIKEGLSLKWADDFMDMLKNFDDSVRLVGLNLLLDIVLECA